MPRVYLDNNATALLDPAVRDTLISAIQQPIGNPSSPHAFGQTAKAYISQARKAIADFCGVKQNQIIFTSGGSEGASLSIRGLLNAKRKKHIIASNVEHACVHETLEILKNEDALITYIPTGLEGAINVDDVARSIRPETQLLVFMAANNETGVLNDIAALGTLAKRHGIPLVVDAVALLGKEELRISPGVTAMFFSGHKIHAPQGVGFVIIQSSSLQPQILGGNQEFGMRGGTENVLGIIGLSKAIAILQEIQSDAILRMRQLRDYFEQALLKLPGISVNGQGKRICNTTNLAFKGIDGETLLITLDQAGIAASLGSACSSGSIEPSRILINMGIPLGVARSSLRFSLSRFTTQEEIDFTISVLKKTLGKHA